MEPVRVLQVVGRMHRAGLETFIMNIYRNIDREKVQFDFLTHYKEKGDYDDEIEELGGKIHRFSVMEDKNLLAYFKELNQFFKSNRNYNIIHGHWATFGLFYLYFAKRNGVKYRISHSHNDRMPPGIRGAFVNTLIKPMKFMANYYFACSEPAIEWLYGKNSRMVKNDEVKIIKNAIDLEKFMFDKKIRHEYRMHLNLENKFVIGHIGRFSYSKNQQFVVDVFSNVYERDKNALLLLIGTGELKEAIEKQVHDLGLSDAVLFLGSRSDIPELLSAMDVFLFPSIYEALGIVVIEAQAAGLPTIVSDAIPTEARITDVIQPLSLDVDKEIWVNEILKSKSTTRKSTTEDLRASGYDIKKQTKYFEDFYLGMKS